MKDCFLSSRFGRCVVSAVLVTFLMSFSCGLRAATLLIEDDSQGISRIACVGDSITAGAGAEDRSTMSYPAQLQSLLGSHVIVKNFGVSGATLLNSGDRPYQKETAFKEALEFLPNVVIILLGTNDTKARNWVNKECYEKDYLNLIGKFQALKTKPKIVIGYPVLVVGEGNFNITQVGVEEQLPMIDRIAEKSGVEVIDLHSILNGHEELIPDFVHPNEAGYGIIAGTIFERLGRGICMDEVSEIEILEWKGFVRKDFRVEGRKGSLIYPEKMAPGKPWIWRTEFLGAFDWVDIALLEQGWVLAYVEIKDLYGSSVAMKAMDSFYNKVITEFALDSKVVLEGFSRGGLYAFNWAARHPGKVSSIYADAPVLDFKSWPAGRGKGIGSAKNWAKCLDVYGLTESEAILYSKNPVDNLKPLADAGIPIIIVAGDSDDVVPAEENTLIAKERYARLGGEMEVVLKPGVGHHPHSLEDPTVVVDFLMNHK